MYVELDVFGAAMMHRVGRHVHCRYVVAVDDGGLGDGEVQFAEQLPQPAAFRDDVGDGVVLSLRAGPGDGGLAFGRPGHERVAEEDGVARGNLSVLFTN
jgi:hypothetical protein